MKTTRAALAGEGQKTTSSTDSWQEQSPGLPARYALYDVDILQEGVQSAEHDNRAYLVAHYKERLRHLEQHRWF